MTGKPSFAKIKSIGDSYGYSAQEMRASRLAGKSLDARKGESARYQIDALTNKIAWCGDEESGLMGVLSDGQNIPLYTIGANASGKTKWAEKSADEILADVNGMAKQVAKITKNVERPDTLCVPADVFMDISTRRIPDTSTTVLAFIQEHAPYIKNVVSTAELDADSSRNQPLRGWRQSSGCGVPVQERPPQADSGEPDAVLPVPPAGREAGNHHSLRGPHRWRHRLLPAVRSDCGRRVLRGEIFYGEVAKWQSPHNIRDNRE